VACAAIIRRAGAAPGAGASETGASETCVKSGVPSR
jgi:hypothetical protein